MKKIFIFLFCILLMACMKREGINVVGSEFLNHKYTLKGDGSEIEAVGYVLVKIESKIDLIKYAKEKQLYLNSSAKFCENGTDLDFWPYLYEDNDDRDGVKRYEFIFSYKGGGYDKYYNLSKKMEKVCFHVGFGSMNPFAGFYFEKKEIKMNDLLIKEMEEYENTSGIVSIKNSSSCANRGCTPNYRIFKE